MRRFPFLASALSAGLLAALLVPVPAAAVEPGAYTPVIGECTNAEFLDGWVLESGPVDCAESHTGQTVYVGTWRSPVSPTEANDLDDKGREQLERQLKPEIQKCDDAFGKYLGMGQFGKVLKATVFDMKETGPNAEQWARGERWFRCDIVAWKPPVNFNGASGELQELPPPDELSSVLQELPVFWGPFTYCVKARPKTTRYAWMSCERPETHRGVAWAWPTGKYPGDLAGAFEQMDRQCAGVVSRLMKLNLSVADVWTLNYSSEPLTKRNYKNSRWLCLMYPI